MIKKEEGTNVSHYGANLFIDNIPDNYVNEDKIKDIVKNIFKLGIIKYIKIEERTSQSGNIYHVAQVEIEWFNSQNNVFIRATLDSFHTGFFDFWGEFGDSRKRLTYFRFKNTEKNFCRSLMHHY